MLVALDSPTTYPFARTNAGKSVAAKSVAAKIACELCLPIRMSPELKNYDYRCEKT
mgnify:CR=1 FL=1